MFVKSYQYFTSSISIYMLNNGFKNNSSNSFQLDEFVIIEDNYTGEVYLFNVVLLCLYCFILNMYNTL